MVLAFFINLGLRSEFKVNVVRDRATLARIVDDGSIENVYRVQVMNTTESPQSYTLEASGLPRLSVHGHNTLTLGPAEARWLVLQVRVPYDAQAKTGSQTIQIRTRSASGQLVAEKAAFYIPR